MLPGAGGGGSNNAEQPRTVFHRALEAVTLTWSDAHLQAILHGDVGSSYACHGCHGARGSYRHSDNATLSVCVKHDVAGRLIWTGVFTVYRLISLNLCINSLLPLVRSYILPGEGDGPVLTD